MGGFVTIKRPNAEKLSNFRLLMMFEGPHCFARGAAALRQRARQRLARSSLQEFLVIILIHCKFEHLNQNYSEILTNFAENLPFLKIKDEGGKLLV